MGDEVYPLGFRRNGLPIWPIMGGDGTDDDGAPGGEGDGAGDGAAAASSLALTPEAIRNSPEFKALEKQNRTLARQKGKADEATALARADAETARQAAEAQQREALEATLHNVLGEDGIAGFNEVAELSQTDPAAAARRFAELMEAGRAQSQPGNGAPAAGDGAPANGGVPVPAQTPPPPARGVDGSVPLGAATTGESLDDVVQALEASYGEVVKRAQDPMTRNRVTMKERSAGFINYLAGGILKSDEGKLRAANRR